jgi:hypothetical protein
MVAITLLVQFDGNAASFPAPQFLAFHNGLRVTPVMEADLRDQAWTLEELVRLMEIPVNIG